MNRRKFLSTAFSTGTLAIAGCAGASNNYPETPEEVSEALVNALLSGDYEAAQLYVKDDMSGELTESFVAEQNAIAERVNAELVGSELIEKTDNRAQVDCTIVGDSSMGASSFKSRQYLVEEGGKWLVERLESL